jgi:hypothetical protein
MKWSSYLCLGSILSALIGLLILMWGARQRRRHLLWVLIAAVFLIGAGLGAVETVYEWATEGKAGARETDTAATKLAGALSPPTGIPLDTLAPEPTETLPPSATLSATATIRPTFPPKSTVTPAPTATVRATPKAQSTATATPSPTSRPTAAPQFTPTSTPLATLRPSPPAGPTATPTLAPTSRPIFSPANPSWPSPGADGAVP